MLSVIGNMVIIGNQKIWRSGVTGVVVALDEHFIIVVGALLGKILRSVRKISLGRAEIPCLIASSCVANVRKKKGGGLETRKTVGDSSLTFDTAAREVATAIDI